ncbi:hypothetical protein U3516DRAFT_542767, partial [Neocallimastix sp. 'constans']
VNNCDSSFTDTNCSTSNNPEVGNYCIKDNVIYALNKNDDTKCINKLKLSSSINLVLIDGVNINIFDHKNVPISEDYELPNLVLINCENDICNQTVGYVLDKNSNYLIKKG